MIQLVFHNIMENMKAGKGFFNLCQIQIKINKLL